MKIAVDARQLASPRGVGEYTRHMLAALAEQFPHDELLRYAPPPSALRRATFASAALLGRPTLDRLVGGGVDVAWAAAPGPLAVSGDVPFVLTVHDLSWVQRPRDFTPYERLWHAVGRLRRLARRADRVVVDAAATIAPLVTWGVDRERIRVVHPGVPRRQATRPPAGTPERFVLFVGALEPRKDPELLVRAHAKARSQGLDAELVLAGTGRLAPRLRAPGVHVVESFDHGELGALYEQALALALPSHLEGFGFTPLEAARAGTPSIVSDLAVFAETLGDAATRVPAGDEDAWARALLDVTQSPPNGDPARAAQRFTWERASRGLHAVFEEVAR